MPKVCSASLLFAITCFFFASCNKEPNPADPFALYTPTDSTCQITGAIDSSDWTSDFFWTSTETNLLKFNDSMIITDSLRGTVELSPACFNPSGGLFLIGLNTQYGCKMKYAIVNNKYQVLHYASRKFTGGPALTSYDLRHISAFHKGNNYRMYYAFYIRNDSLIYKGHGDIRIE